MMKRGLALAMVVSFGGLVTAQSGNNGVVHILPAQLNASWAKGGSLLARADFKLSGSHRETGGQVEVHVKETDILYITDGEATFVTGGTMVGGKVSAPDQMLGTDITGGQTAKIAKGDVFIV